MLDRLIYDCRGAEAGFFHIFANKDNSTANPKHTPNVDNVGWSLLYYSSINRHRHKSSSIAPDGRWQILQCTAHGQLQSSIALWHNTELVVDDEALYSYSLLILPRAILPSDPRQRRSLHSRCPGLCMEKSSLEVRFYTNKRSMNAWLACQQALIWDP